MAYDHNRGCTVSASLNTATEFDFKDRKGAPSRYSTDPSLCLSTTAYLVLLVMITDAEESPIITMTLTVMWVRRRDPIFPFSFWGVLFPFRASEGREKTCQLGRCCTVHGGNCWPSGETHLDVPSCVILSI